MAAMSAEVTERALDLAYESEVAGKLHDLASTDTSARWLAEFLDEAVSREVLPWQIGEAIAEAVLEGSRGVIFPWNTRRDERNPRASLQGADIVGISDEPQGSRLVFGEVKSSSDRNSPPIAVTGKSGLDRQLERLIDDNELKYALIKWLAARVGGADGTSFDEALTAFIGSGGASVRFIGVLVRDTPANENDVSRRGRALGGQVSEPGSVELYAMYMPRPMAEWTRWVAA